MNIFKLVTLSAVLVAVTGVTACVQLLGLPRVGATYTGESTSPLAVSVADQQELWETEDLKLLYSLSTDAESSSISGELSFDRSLTGTFDRIRSFNLQISFVNDQRQVVAAFDVTPFYRVRSVVPTMLPVKGRFEVPAEATGVVFSYYGTFHADELDMGPWEISHTPFR